MQDNIMKRSLIGTYKLCIRAIKYLLMLCIELLKTTVKMTFKAFVISTKYLIEKAKNIVGGI